MAAFQSVTQDAPAVVSNLRCEYQANPLGIDTPQPRLSWKIITNRRGARQTAYRVLAAQTPEDLVGAQNLLWDTGRIESDQSIHVRYHGPALISRQRVWWLVQIWDESGHLIVSEPSWWEMGLLEHSDWSAEWIEAPLAGGPRASVPVPFFRRSFAVAKPVRDARLYVTALGLYECVMNGQPIGEDVFAPGWTDYNKRVQYHVYDVTPQIHAGENVIGAILGDGWYAGSVGWKGRQNYGDRPRLLARLEIRHTDGTESVVVTDGNWRVSFGPILESDFLMGESYDARLEISGWDLPGFDDHGWLPVGVFTPGEAKLVARRGPAVRRVMEIAPVGEPVCIGAWPGAKWIFDLGQNMVGRVRLKVNGPAGTTVTLRFAEILNPDGSFYTTNLRSARATDYYTLKGAGDEIYEPRFTFHGFRYVELSGFPGMPGRDAVTGIVLHSDMADAGSFACSDALINQLQHNIQWGQRGNFIDVPTDCPQRDERLGWTGDAQVFIRTAAFNMDVAGFFTKWVQDLADSQSPLGQIPSVAPNVLGSDNADGGPAWADAFTICPWTIYLAYGDKEMLAAHYPNIKRYVDHMAEVSVGFIRCHPDGPFENGDRDGYGDWLSINAETPKDLIGTAFLAHSARLLSKMAAVLGNEVDCQIYQDLAENVRQAFLRRYVTQEGLVAAQTQTAYVLALHFDLLPEQLRTTAVQELVRDIHQRGDHLSTGFVGAPYLMHVLSRAGRNDVAYTLLHQKSWPSWLYPVTQGATTIWERWDGWTHDKGFQDPGMNSFNHYAYGSIGDWLYATVAGIEVDAVEPGYKHTILRPQPGGGLTFAEASHETLFGKVSSAWRYDGNVFVWQVTVPPNTEATLHFPVEKGAAIMEGEIPIERSEGLTAVDAVHGVVYRAVSGSYTFRITAD